MIRMTPLLPLLFVLPLLMGQEECESDSDADQDGFTIGDGDCDDTLATIYPGAKEICDGLDNNCNGEADLDGPCNGCLGDGTPVQITVEAGYTSGSYPAGSQMHLFADIDPKHQLVTQWNHPELNADWHQRITVPDQDLLFEPTIYTHDFALITDTFQGTTDVDKTLHYYIPDNPKGLILFHHGTGGNADFILQTETYPAAMRAIAAGYGVLSTQAEESAAGDLNGDGKRRWDAGIHADNIDFANLNQLIAGAKAQNMIPEDLPLYALGMSNGGSFSVTLGALEAELDISPLFPHLVFKGVASYCAHGRSASTDITLTPTAWYLCGYDQYDEGINQKAAALSAEIAHRGIPTDYQIHPPSPLYDQRFARVEGINKNTSVAMATEIRDAGLVNTCGYLKYTPDELEAFFDANPSDFPTFEAMDWDDQREVKRQLKVIYADHQMYSDYMARTLQFFGQF